jgi:hypothetical protein
MRNKKNSRFYCYVFGGASDSHIQLLFQSIRHSIREAYTKISDAEEDGKDLGVMSDRNSLRRYSLVAETDSLESKYDVHYIGRLRVSGPHGNKTLVDEVLQTIRRRHSTQSNSLPKGKCPTANLFFKDCQFTVTSHFIKLVDKHTQAVYLHKSIASVSYCARGLSHQDYMAVICREATEGHLFCYVVHRPYPDSIEPLLESMQEAFTVAYESSCHRPLAICESCPMHQLHLLCHQVEGVGVEIGQNIIHKVVQSLPETEFSWIQQKFEEHKKKDSQTQNIIMISLLRAVYEKLQLQHTHKENAQTTPHPNESMDSDKTSDVVKQRPRGMSRFKESLASSLENLLNRREKNKNQRSKSLTCPEDSSKGRVSPLVVRRLPDNPITETQASVSPPGSPQLNQPMSSTSKGTRAAPPIIKMMKQVVASPTEADADKQQHDVKQGERKPSSRRLSSSLSADRKQSWRHSMYVKAHETEISSLVGIDEVDGWYTWPSPKRMAKKKQKTSEDYRRLWRDAIDQQTMLNRMHKMNRDFDDESSAAEEKRLKLFYDGKDDDVTDGDEPVHQMLDRILLSLALSEVKKDDLKAAILAGVPKSRREEMWSALAVCFKSMSSPFATSDMWAVNDHKTDNFESLKDGQTEYQHAIFTDLHRTFPRHPYFRKSSGRGQTALYNVLKAYSVFDQEVGYCQGLGFIAGLFVIHCRTEKDAFYLLQRFMLNYNFRRHYLPDMEAMQLRLYQLSRLLHDLLPRVFDHLDILNIPPFVYAAPWILTLFASQFPIRFASRVMDFVLLEGVEGMFKIIFCLLRHLENDILSKHDFETTIEFMKTEVPKLMGDRADHLVEEAMKMTVDQQLAMYSVEYTVLKEAMPDEPVETRDTTAQELSDAKKRAEKLECELAGERRRVKIMQELLDR